MSSKKRVTKSPQVPRPLADLARFLVGPGRTLALALLMAAFFGAAWYWGWQQVRGDVLVAADYTLSPEDIVVTSKPGWNVDIRGKVFRDASLQQQLSIMDPDLNQRVADAFSHNPWVAKVRSVSKRYPAAVEVDLEYRRPVCVVETCDEFIPVDVEGNVLPKDDLSLSERLRYPRLECKNISTPRGTEGDRWGDLKVVGAAEIAAALGERWRTYDLERIVPVESTANARSSDIVFELYTPGGSIVVWGHAPSLAPPDEPTPAEKIEFLDRCMEHHGTLEGKTGPHQIDILFHLRNRMTFFPDRESARSRG